MRALPPGIESSFRPGKRFRRQANPKNSLFTVAIDSVAGGRVPCAVPLIAIQTCSMRGGIGEVCGLSVSVVAGWRCSLDRQGVSDRMVSRQVTLPAFVSVRASATARRMVDWAAGPRRAPSAGICCESAFSSEISNQCRQGRGLHVVARVPNPAKPTSRSGLLFICSLLVTRAGAIRCRRVVAG